MDHLMVLKSLTYFDDADIEPDPLMLVPIEWNSIKESIIHSVEEFFNQNQFQ